MDVLRKTGTIAVVGSDGLDYILQIFDNLVRTADGLWVSRLDDGRYKLTHGDIVFTPKP